MAIAWLTFIVVSAIGANSLPYINHSCDQFETKSLNETRDMTFKGEKAVEIRMAGISVEGKHERSSRCVVLKRKGILYIIQFEIPRGREADHARDLKACEKAVVLTG